MKSGKTTFTGFDLKKVGILKDARMNPLSASERTALAATLSSVHTGILTSDDITGELYRWDGTMFVPVGVSIRFGIEDILGVQNRAINMETFNFVLTNGGVYELNTLSFTVACLQAANSSKFSAARNGSHNYALIQTVNDGVTREIILQNDRLAVNNNSAFLQRFVESITADRYIPLTVNTIAADITGNITLNIPAVNESILFENVSEYTLLWTTARITNYGVSGIFYVEIVGDDGIARNTTVEIIPNSIINTTSYHFDFGGTATGRITIS